MTSRLMLMAMLMASALLCAWLLRARIRPRPQQLSGVVPSQIDRADFANPHIDWLVVVFTSKECTPCARTTEKAKFLASDSVVFQEVSVTDQLELHNRYFVQSTPLTLICDPKGIVKAAFAGEPTTADLWAAVAGLRSESVQEPSDA